jgi:hypothetical protein
MDPSVFDNANPEGREGETDQEVTVPDTVGVWTLMACVEDKIERAW